jgi:hypothetical protein
MVKRRYPIRAILAVTGASLLLVFNMITGFMFMALVLPMIPVFITILMGNTCLLISALDYAGRVSVPSPTAMLPAGKHGSQAQAGPLTARTT